MESKKDIDALLKRIKNLTKLTQEQIARRINYSREYLSQAKKTNPEGLYDLLEMEFSQDLLGIQKPSKPGKKENMQLAMLKMLYQRMAKSESARLGIPIEKVMEEMDAETMINWRDLESEN